MHEFRRVVALVAVALALSGCGTTPGCRALTGAGLGAAGGALIGAVGGNVVAGAVTGGVVGAAIGGLTSAKQIHAGRGPCK
jgi:osmotically inducible lipoprotein OsmB